MDKISLFDIYFDNMKHWGYKSEEEKKDFREKFESDYFKKIISILPDSVECFQKKEYIELFFRSYLSPNSKGEQYETGGDYVSLYLPLPLEFNEKWIEKYIKLNYTISTVESCLSEGYIKK